MQDYVGEIRLFAGQQVRKGWVLCEGQCLPKEKYGYLAPLLYEAAGRLKVPNLKPVQPQPHIRFALCTKGVFPAAAT